MLDKILSVGVKAIMVQADAGSITFGEDLVNATVNAFPGRKIDIIVNNAGYAAFYEGADAPSAEEFDVFFHPNVRGPHLLTKAALPHLQAPGGRIINISSVVARTGAKVSVFYCSTKSALNTLTRTWAEELGPRGITVNVVSPGPIDTDYVPPEEAPVTQWFRAQQIVKRNGTADEVANVIMFAASPGASFISGQVLPADGGMSYT